MHFKNICFSNSFTQAIAGNIDRNRVVGNILEPAIIARHIRIHPKTWNSVPALRFEVYGCKDGEQSEQSSNIDSFLWVWILKSKRWSFSGISFATAANINFTFILYPQFISVRFIVYKLWQLWNSTDLIIRNVLQLYLWFKAGLMRRAFRCKLITVSEFWMITC